MPVPVTGNGNMCDPMTRSHDVSAKEPSGLGSMAQYTLRIEELVLKMRLIVKIPDMAASKP